MILKGGKLFYFDHVTLHRLVVISVMSYAPYSVSNHQQLYYVYNRFFKLTAQKTS